MLPPVRLAGIGVELVVLRSAEPGGDAEQPLEGREHVAASVESEDLLVEVGLQVLPPDGTVVRALELWAQTSPARRRRGTTRSRASRRRRPGRPP
jgi:hypothetical protein